MEEEVKKKKKSNSNTKSTTKKSNTKKVSSTKKPVTKKSTSKKVSTTKKSPDKKVSTTKKNSTKKPTTKKVSTTKKKTNSSTKKKTTSNKSKTTSNKVKTNVKEEVKTSLEKKDNKKTKIILDIIIYVIGLVLIVCLILLYFQRKRDNETIKELEETVINDEIEIVDDKTVKDYIDELKTKYNNNNDIKGILSIDGLDESIPIVKGKDNSYYLSHAVNKKKSIIGSVFIDYRNNLSSRQINIYGHNSTKFNPPFKVLEGYLNKDYYDEHKYFEFMVNDEVRKYEIFSVIIADKDNDEEHMQFSYKKDSDWLKHYQRLQKRSKYKINVNVSKDDNIMVLQTCIFGRYHGKLLVIVGKEIERK